ncbi:Sirohydrochlorin cobaltochelatase [Novipirellula aureliae]|uniref:Sirohydrochlorin cobaltochelatase n=1 Tax=Novipirellula aureliae TaxID=2527966 RepID=A0A5C6DBE3_9BACT|nr:sirohydrochlorin chelatase [Novipirellula aureliae]TWU34180.1 Sirohydrochlorin cobaltochelatase [Novipirellula aureliae]
MTNDKYQGVLLVGHGTRDAQGTKQFFDLGELLKMELTGFCVEPCLLEFQSPTIPDAWDRLLERDIKRICVAPLLLFAAGHAKQDIPEIVMELHDRTPDVEVTQARPISRQSAMIELACAHLRHAMDKQQWSADAVTLVTVGRGSYDPCAQADMRVLGSIVASKLSVGDHHNAFYAMAEPKLPDVLDLIARLRPGGSTNSILVHPHLLFDGRLYQAIQRQVNEFRDRHPEIPIHLSSYLGADKLVAQAMADRVKSALDLAVHTPSLPLTR